jgi:4-amino-4-deoxy-L-arabinose transferase-like glycosyltransferase
VSYSKLKEILLGKVSITIVLIVVAFYFRVYLLEDIPNGLNWDETSYAYNAYSIAQTGKDEWGYSYPIFLKSFGEYKPAFLSYLIIPFLEIFPTGNLAVRLPNVILGSIAIGITYLLFLKLTRSKFVSLLTATTLAITPWHIHFSRIALDPGLGHSLMLLGLFFWINEKKSWQVLGTLFLSLAMYTYNAQRIFIPLLILAFSLIWGRKKIVSFIKQRLISLLLLTLTTTLILGSTLWGDIGTRARDSSFIDDGLDTNSPLSLILTKKATKFIHNYAKYYQPKFLFFKGGWINASPILGFPGRGNLLEVFLPFFIIGLIPLIRNRNKLNSFIIIWLLLAPIPGALTMDSPHPGRALTMLPAINYVVALGILFLTKKIKIFKPRLILSFLWLIITANYLAYQYEYTSFYKKNSEHIYQGQFKSVSKKIKHLQDENNYQNIYFTQDVDDKALLFYAWYSRFNPQDVQRSEREAHYSSDIKSYANFSLLDGSSREKFCRFATTPNSLFILAPNESNSFHTTPIATTYYKNSREAFYIFDSNLIVDLDKNQIVEMCNENSS